MNKDCIAGEPDNIGFVCIESECKGKRMLCFHKGRKSRECPGGHVEPGEEPLAAAKRELFEKTRRRRLYNIPVWDYQVFDDDGKLHNNRRVCYSEISEFSHLPEISETKSFT